MDGHFTFHRFNHNATVIPSGNPMTQRYNTGNPRPSNSMKDLNDNALANDDYMNSEADTFIDRLGDERDTLRGSTKKMLAAGAAVVEETRQNLIPLSKQYMTLAAAQADIANIPEGSTTYYRSPDDSALAIEVMNVGGTLQPTGRRMLRDDYGYQVSPDCVALAGYDPETKRVAPFLNTEGRLIQIGPDGKYYEVLTPPEAELYALGSDGQVTQFIGGEKVWRMIVDATTNQIVEAYTVGGHHWIYSDSGLVLVNQESGGGGDDDTTILPEYGLHLSGSTVYPYSETVPVCFIFVTAGQSNARGYCPDTDQTIVAATHYAVDLCSGHLLIRVHSQ